MSIIGLISLLLIGSDLQNLLDRSDTSLALYSPLQNRYLIADQIDHLRVPASTLKIMTAYLALNHWGRQHRFKTDFYWQNGQMWVKGYGDPWLTSEQINVIAQQLKKRGLKRLYRLHLDTRYYVSDLHFDGQGQSLNPYDACLSALAANFNTLFIGKDKSGHLYSAESQTPWVPLAAQWGVHLKRGQKARLPIHDPQKAALYFGQLLLADLKQIGVQTEGAQIDFSSFNAVPKYRHQSPPLQSIIQAMLKYSNNFIANQLMLNLSAEYGPPASFKKVSFYLQHQIEKLGWSTAHLIEGSVLSKKNQINAEQMIQLLQLFLPYADLMPEVAPHLYLKSGTLHGLSHYAGYIEKAGVFYPVVLFLDFQPPYYDFRLQTIKMISQYIYQYKPKPK